MSTERIYLVIGADRRVRTARNPRVRPDQVAIAIDLRFPASWGRVIQHLDVEVPDFAPEAEFPVEEEETDDE